MAMTEEQKKAFGQKMAAARAAKKAQTADVSETISVEDYNELKRQIEELKNSFRPVKEQNVAQVSGTKLLGRTDRYSIDPLNYDDPRARLAKEPKLARFAFDLNYDLNWEFSTVSYQTLDGLNMREPKFTLELAKVVLDENTGEPTNGRYVIARLIMHEDPDVAISVARQEGLDIDEDDEVAFLNEIRYIRMRDWLLSIFYPAAINSTRKKQQQVIGGKLVEFYEISSENREAIPFEELRKF